MERTEGKIQAEIVKYLQSKGIFCHSIPNEAQGRGVVAQGQLVAMGLRKGVGDLIVWLCENNKTIVSYFEVKSPAGQQSDAQKVFEEKCKEHGIPYYIVRSVEDVKNIIEK